MADVEFSLRQDENTRGLIAAIKDDLSQNAVYLLVVL